MYRQVLIDPTFSPLTVFFNQMKHHVTMIVCDKKAFKWGVTRYPRFFLTTCEPVAFCLHLCFLTLSQYPMCTKFEIVYPRDLPVSEWVDSKTRAHLIQIIRWKTHCWISSTCICQIRDCVSAGSLRLRMRGLKSRAHLIQKYTYPTSLISSWTCIFVNTFLASMWALFCNAFLIRLSDFRHEITLEFAGPVFSRSPLLKATDAMFLATYGLCVWGQPLFRRAFITCPIFSFSSQFTGRGHSDSEWVDWKAGLI